MKDAKGHGSNSRGGSQAAHQQGVGKIGAPGPVGWAVSLTGEGTHDGKTWEPVQREFTVPARRANSQADAEGEAIKAHEEMGWYRNMKVTKSEPV